MAKTLLVLLTLMTFQAFAASELKVKQNNYLIHISEGELELNSLRFKVHCQASSKYLSLFGPLFVKNSYYSSPKLNYQVVDGEIDQFKTVEVTVPEFKMKVKGPKALWFDELNCYAGFEVNSTLKLTGANLKGEASLLAASIYSGESIPFSEYNQRFNQYLSEQFEQLNVFSYRVEHLVGGGVDPIPYCDSQLELMFWSDPFRVKKEIDEEKNRDQAEGCSDRWTYNRPN